MRKLSPKAKLVFFIRNFVGLFMLYLFLGGYLIYIPLFIRTAQKQSANPFSEIMFVSLLVFLAIVVFSWIFAVLGYKNYWFEIGEEFVVIHRGVFWKSKTSIPYKRIQDATINRGILAQLMNFSGIKIETAGQSGQYAMSEGVLPVLEQAEAEAISKQILDKVKGQQGL